MQLRNNLTCSLDPPLTQSQRMEERVNQLSIGLDLISGREQEGAAEGKMLKFGKGVNP